MRDLDELVHDAREVDKPTSAEASQLFDSVSAGLAAAPLSLPTELGPLGVEGVAGPGAVASATTFFSGNKLLVALGVAVGGGSLVSVGLLVQPEEVPRVPAGRQPAVTARALQPSLANSTETISKRDPQPALQHSPDERSTKTASKPVTGQKVANDPLTAELRLVRQAKLKHNAKQHSAALKLLDEYARRFPKGSLKAEAQATRVLALCALGLGEQARTAAGQLDQNSALGRKLNAGCRAR